MDRHKQMHSLMIMMVCIYKPPNVTQSTKPRFIIYVFIILVFNSHLSFCLRKTRTEWSNKKAFDLNEIHNGQRITKTKPPNIRNKICTN